MSFTLLKSNFRVIFATIKMNNKCKYLKQKFNNKLECKIQNKIIKIYDCSNCKYKEYDNKEQCTLKKNKQSKRTKALAIPTKIKKIVWERDNHRCIFCHCEVPWNRANSHFVKRSHGGLGIEENILTNCPSCHKQFDDSIERKNMLPIAENYLKSKYENWKKDELVYKKEV